MKYAVVIVTYNRKALLEECLDCVQKQTLPFSEVIIVNNASTDGTAEMLEAYRLNPKYRILTQMENLGGSGGFHAGLKEAGKGDSDWTLIIDDDAMLAPDFLFQCDRYISTHPDCSAVSGTVRTNGEIQTNHRRRIGNRLIHSERDVLLSEYEKESFPYDYSTFCGLMIKTEVIRKIGLPKAEYFIWYDDTEYSMRLAPFGGIINVNAAELNHKTKITIGNTGFFERMNWKTYYGHRNRYDAVLCHCSRATQLCVGLEFSVFLLCADAMQLIPAKRERGAYISAMLRQARCDAKSGHLGKNSKYLP